MKLAFYPSPISKVRMWRDLAGAAEVTVRSSGYMFGVPFPSAEDRAAAEQRVSAQAKREETWPPEEIERRIRRSAAMFHRARLVCEGALRRGYRHLGMWNGQGGRRKTLVDTAQRLGMKMLFAELAPIAGHVTLDPGGVNAAGILSRDPLYYAAWGAAHADSGSVEQWRARLVTRAGQRRSNQGEVGTGPFLFVPLQVRGDTQITTHGGWIRSVPMFIDAVAEASRHLPEGWRVVFREHPSDREGNTAQLSRLVGPRVVVDNETDTFELVRRSEGVVTVNSSVGMQSLLFGKPVLALGHANYTVPGVAGAAGSIEELHLAFERAGSWEIDLRLTDAFLRFLADEYYVRWPMTDAAARERVGVQVRGRMDGRLTDWVEERA